MRSRAPIALLVALVACGPEGRETASGLPEPTDPLIRRVTDLRLGDLPEMREIAMIRALVVPDRTGFFIQNGRPRGFEVELLEAYEKRLNEGRSRRERKIEMVYVPVAFDELLPALREGRGDLAAAGLTVTPERSAEVDFSDPYLEVDEVVVVHAGVPPLESLEDLAGRTVHVARSTSYAEHLRALSERLEPPIDVVEVDVPLDTEDVLEMVHAGVLEFTVADHHLAELWARVLDDIVVQRDLRVHEGGRLAWAVRKESPKLRASLNRFLREHRKGTLLGNVLFRRYYGNTHWITHPLAGEGLLRLARFEPYFRKYAERYGFDWMKIAAQAYQESGLDPGSESPAGAVGLMQLLPTTASDPNVGISGIRDPERNIHAGVKYMAFLRDRYVADPGIPAPARFDLALAAYNMGPARLMALRREAAERGLDANRWFNHVERIALERVGQEPVRYVANVNKYYLAYRLARRARPEQTEAAG